MSNRPRIALVAAIGVALVAVGLYSALPARLSPVQVIQTGDTETAVKIVGDHGGGVTRTFSLPAAPRNTPRLALALRPATYLEPPSGTITVVVGARDRCVFGPDRYTDGGTIACAVTHPGATKVRVSVRGASGPVALIERTSPAGENLAGLWVQVPSDTFEGRLRFVRTALSTTRPWLFSWPVAIFGFALATCGALWIGLSAVSDDDLEPSSDSRFDTAASR